MIDLGCELDLAVRGSTVHSLLGGGFQSPVVSLAKTDGQSHSLGTHTMHLDPQISRGGWGRGGLGQFPPFPPCLPEAPFAPTSNQSSYTKTRLQTKIHSTSSSSIQWLI